MRRSRYVGLAKTHAQHLFIATAMNLWRIVNWLNEVPLAQTRQAAFERLDASRIDASSNGVKPIRQQYPFTKRTPTSKTSSVVCFGTPADGAHSSVRL